MESTTTTVNIITTERGTEAVSVVMELSSRNQSDNRKQLLVDLCARAVMDAELDVKLLDDQEVARRVLQIRKDRVVSSPLNPK